MRAEGIQWCWWAGLVGSRGFGNAIFHFCSFLVTVRHRLLSILLTSGVTQYTHASKQYSRNTVIELARESARTGKKRQKSPATVLEVKNSLKRHQSERSLAKVCMSFSPLSVPAVVNPYTRTSFQGTNLYLHHSSIYLHSQMECATGVICPSSMPLYSSSHAS